MRITFIGAFSLAPKSTMLVRALPLARALVKLGHQVRIVMPPWHTHGGARTWEDSGVELQDIAVSSVPLLENLITTFRLLRAGQAFQPDVIHFFKPKAYAGLAAWFLWQFRFGKRPRIVLDEDDWEGYGGWNEFVSYPEALKRFFSWQERWGLAHCDALTVASRALQTIAWSLGIAPRKVVYLPNGAQALPVGGLDVRARYQLGEAPVVLLYTRFTEFHPERLAAVWRGIHDGLPEARLLIVGQALDDDTELVISKLLADYQDSIIRVGWVPLENVHAYLSSADVALFPCDDTLINRCKCSVKLTDLLSEGLPVVADNVGQNSEYIRHNESGVLVSAGDTSEMVDAVVTLLQDSARRQRISQAAREKMQADFSWEVMACEALRAYSGKTSP